MALFSEITNRIETAAKESAYTKDATEKDPRYRSLGLRAPQIKAIVKEYNAQFKQLSTDETLALIGLFIKGYGEQQSIAIRLMTGILDHYTPSNFYLLDQYLDHLCGWSKIDDIGILVLQPILRIYPKEFYQQLTAWNKAPEYWKRRASVITFTRKIGASGQFTEQALTLCENIIDDEHDLVRKGIGWCLKDVMKGDKERVITYVKELRQRNISAVITLYALRDIKGDERKELLNSKK